MERSQGTDIRLDFGVLSVAPHEAETAHDYWGLSLMAALGRARARPGRAVNAKCKLVQEAHNRGSFVFSFYPLPVRRRIQWINTHAIV